MQVHKVSYQRETVWVIKYFQHRIPHFAFLSKKKILKQNGHPEHFEIYFCWWNHQMHFKIVNLNIHNAILELVNLKCVTYAQPISLSLMKRNEKWLVYYDIYFITFSPTYRYTCWQHWQPRAGNNWRSHERSFGNWCIICNQCSNSCIVSFHFKWYVVVNRFFFWKCLVLKGEKYRFFVLLWRYKGDVNSSKCDE